MIGSDDRDTYTPPTDEALSWHEPDEERLALAEDDERLPWLESGEEETRHRAIDSNRLIGFGLLGLVGAAILAGAIWWVATGGASGGPEPDGSLIAAPEEPYKKRPENPGGRVVEGTGDTSFAVGEGETREGRLRDDPEPTPDAAQPSLATVSTPRSEPTPARTQMPTAASTTAPTPAPIPKPAASPEPARGTLVQVGAYSQREQAQDGWRTLTRQTTHLDGVKYRIVRGQADIGTVYRLQATMGSRGEASALCSALKGDGLACQVK